MLSPAPCAQYLSNPHTFLQVNGKLVACRPPTAAQASGCRECDAGAHPRLGDNPTISSRLWRRIIRFVEPTSGTLDYRI